jgi:hypothetical protein
MIVKEIWSRVRLILRVQLLVRLTLRDSKNRGQKQEERFQDQLLIGARLDTINDRVNKFKLALEVYEQDFIRETFEKVNTNLTLY